MLNPEPTAVGKFVDIKQIESARREGGCDYQYVQLQAGRLRVRTSGSNCPGVVATRESGNLSVEVMRQSPPGRFTVLLPQAGSELWVNGHTITQGDLLLLPPTIDLHRISRPNCEFITLWIPESLVIETAASLAPSTALDRLVEPIHLRAGSHRAGKLAQLSALAVQPPSSCASCAQLANDFVIELVSVMATQNGAAERTLGQRGHETLRTVNRAYNYIEAHLGEPIRMGDLCRHTGVSLSKLERVFRHALHTSPTGYIKARRLAAAQSTLSQNSADRRIADIAMEHGFTHLGRFSAAYRAQFGVLPSHQRPIN